MSEKKVFVLDVDGVLTPGNFFYTEHGKIAKEFGPDDFELLKEVAESIPVHFITGDEKGFPITHKRLHVDCGYPLYLVPVDGGARWDWIRDRYPDHHIIFMGDGCKDHIALANSDFSITTCDALEYNKANSNIVTRRAGGSRAVAEACIAIIQYYNLPSFLSDRMIDQVMHTGS